MNSMYDLAAKHFIEVKEVDLGNSLDGLYVEDVGVRCIFLHHRIFNNTAHARCVFAEELGHYFTTSGVYIHAKNETDRSTINRIELKALKWAAAYLIPENDLLDALRDNIYEEWELAEYFNVTEEMVHFRLQLFKGIS